MKDMDEQIFVDCEVRTDRLAVDCEFDAVTVFAHEGSKTTFVNLDEAETRRLRDFLNECLGETPTVHPIGSVANVGEIKVQVKVKPVFTVECDESPLIREALQAALNSDGRQ